MSTFEVDPARRENRLLAALPVNEQRRLNLEPVSLTLKQSIYEQNQPIEYVYFPTTAIISQIARMSNGAVAEVATIGREGFVGLPVFLGTDRTTLVAFAQVAGEAFRTTAAHFRSEMQRAVALPKLLLRYTESLLVQIAQGSACSQLHPVQQRCARWLLATHDRVGSDEFLITHEFLCQMLGVRRATVSEVLHLLQQIGLIRYSRGKMTVLNREGLEAASCECYRVIRTEYERTVSDISDEIDEKGI